MAALLAKLGDVGRENASLQADLSASQQQVSELSEQVRQLNQRRQDAGKAIDELIHQIDSIEAQFEQAGD